MKKVLLIVSITVVLSAVSFFVYNRFIFKHNVNIEELVSFNITGEEGNVKKEIVIKEGINKEVESFIKSLEFDYTPIENAKHNTSIEVLYTCDTKLLNKYRIKLDSTNDGLLNVEVGPLSYYIRQQEDLTPEIIAQINSKLQTKIDDSRQEFRDSISCAPCNLEIISEDSPVLLVSEGKIAQDFYVSNELYKYRYQVSLYGRVEYFDQYIMTVYTYVHVLEDGSIELGDKMYAAFTLDFSMPNHYVSEQSAIDKFYSVINDVK